MPRDVVCGMGVEREQATGVSSYRGKQYYFGHNDVRTTIVYTHVLNRGGRDAKSPVDSP